MPHKPHTVFLRGGLGNQFFQWTYAMWLLDQGHAVCLDSSFVRHIKGNQALGEVELMRVFNDLHMPVTARFRRFARGERYFVRLAHAASVVRIEGKRPWLPGTPRLHYGYYQTPRHFTDAVAQRIRASVRPAFEPKAHPAFPPSLRDVGYAAIHLRGGDYLQEGYNFTELGVLAPGYYRQALSLAAIAQMPVVIVSDDERRARRIVNEVGPRGLNIHHLSDLSSNSGDPLLALSVMSGADVLVCANSSFSAMAGCINPRASVCFPKPWFRGPSLAWMSPTPTHWRALAATFES